MVWKRSPPIRALILALMFPVSWPVSWAQAQVQSRAPADLALVQTISTALVKAGIDPRTTSVQVVIGAGHTVILKGLISNADTIKLAGVVAAKTAPGYRVENDIKSSFFDGPNRLQGQITK